jgi:hypothetical protein
MFSASGYHKEDQLTAMNIVEHLSLWHGGPSFWYMLKNGIARYSGRSISHFLSNLQIDFQSGCTNLQSHQQWRSVSLSPHLHQYFLSPEFLILAILTGHTPILSVDLRLNVFCREECLGREDY